ncbi:non-specific lipid transfer protein GPI-anchored 20 [Triticum aestivum]|nr:non-specific lipid transfer protein GPI-anchored 20-like [Triticum aestivum]
MGFSPSGSPILRGGARSAKLLLVVACPELLLPESGSCTVDVLLELGPLVGFCYKREEAMSAKYLQALERRGDWRCTGVDCVCLILSRNVPFGLPISHTLAICFPKVCKSLSVQLMCRDTATQIPAPRKLPSGSLST